MGQLTGPMSMRVTVPKTHREAVSVAASVANAGLW